jgi:hypothetical protein
VPSPGAYQTQLTASVNQKKLDEPEATPLVQRNSARWGRDALWLPGRLTMMRRLVFLALFLITTGCNNVLRSDLMNDTSI